MKEKQQIIKIRLPEYERKASLWRRAIHQELSRAYPTLDVVTDPVELIVTLYFDDRRVHWNDVDNRLKDVMDALQGRLGGPKSLKLNRQFIANDNQVCRVEIEKMIAPKQSHGKGHLVVRKYVKRKGAR